MKTVLSLFVLLPALVLTLLSDSAVRADRSASVSTQATAVPTESTAPGTPLVVLELFTSQGCSSCPPADALLSELHQRSTAGEPIVALSYHVDYWNYLGWEDPFSSPYYSARQRDYTERLRARTYTPQLVVNGTHELVGSRSKEVKALVDRAIAARSATAVPTVTVEHDGSQVAVSYALEQDRPEHRVTALLVQREATSAVRRGENRGRQLSHHNVVRQMKHAPAAAVGNFSLTVPDGLTAREVSVVLLVQDVETQAIVGATRQALK